MNKSAPALSPEDVAERIIGEHGLKFGDAYAMWQFSGNARSVARETLALKQAIVDAIKAAQNGTS